MNDVYEVTRPDNDADYRTSSVSKTKNDSGISANIRAYIEGRFPLFISHGMNEESSLLESGVIDSLGILDVVAYLETEFAITIDNDDVSPEHFGSVTTLAKLVQMKRPGA